jgi:hypothetical protein
MRHGGEYLPKERVLSGIVANLFVKENTMCAGNCEECGKCNPGLVKTIEKAADRVTLLPYYSTHNRHGILDDAAKWRGGTKPQPIMSNIQAAFVNAVVKAHQ